MLQCPEGYDGRLVAPLQALDLGEIDTVVQLVGVRDLFPGMVLAEDVRTKTGSLVLAKGHEITYTMMERLRSYAWYVDIAQPFRVRVPRQRS